MDPPAPHHSQESSRDSRKRKHNSETKSGESKENGEKRPRSNGKANDTVENKQNGSNETRRVKGKRDVETITTIASGPENTVVKDYDGTNPNIRVNRTKRRNIRRKKHEKSASKLVDSGPSLQHSGVFTIQSVNREVQVLGEQQASNYETAGLDGEAQLGGRKLRKYKERKRKLEEQALELARIEGHNEHEIATSTLPQEELPLRGSVDFKVKTSRKKVVRKEEKRERKKQKKLDNASKHAKWQNRIHNGGKLSGERQEMGNEKEVVKKKMKKTTRKDALLKDDGGPFLQDLDGAEGEASDHYCDEGRRKKDSAWNVSDPAGGRFLAHDPLFSPDEKFFFISTKRRVGIYSTATSLLARTIAANHKQSITGFALSSTKTSHLYVAHASGTIILYNWETGSEVLVVPAKWPIRALFVTQLHETDYDTVFTIETENSHTPTRKVDHIVARQFDSGTLSVIPRSLWWSPRQDLLFLKVLDGGKVIFAASGKTLVFAKILLESSIESLRYVWRAHDSSELLTCFDAIARPGAGGKDVSKLSKRESMTFNLVCGGVQGTIFIYEDYLHNIEQREAKGALDSVIPPRLIRWHREAVGSVKWSLDGNYVISGGKETVLCLWQMETGKLQSLPHLSSAIESLTVSPKGISYAVQLADNSVMILSTSELEPKANVPSIQTRFVPDSPTLLPRAETLASASGKKSECWLDAYGRTAAVTNPRNQNELLFAVPASQERVYLSVQQPAPFLQTFDVFTGSHVSRQALTRNNATTRTSGPEGNQVKEPNVTHLQISVDGLTLATVEEWVPPATDLDFTVWNENEIEPQVMGRLEIYLKFWRWSEKKRHWMLETSVEFPQQPNKVFDLIAHPTMNAFASIGEDGFVRVWKPKTRLGNRAALSVANADGLVAWTCSRIIELETPSTHIEDCHEFSAFSPVANGTIAYSNDGSILVAALESSSGRQPGPVHFIDSESGSIKYSKSQMYSKRLASMGFIGKYLVLLSHDIRVWDVVSSHLFWGITLNIEKGLSPEQKAMLSHLTINTVSRTFAVAIPSFADDKCIECRRGDICLIKRESIHSTVMIFEPENPVPILYYDTTSPVAALVSFSKSYGYAVLDSAAEYRILSPKNSAAFITSAPIVDVDSSLKLIEERDFGAEAVGEANAGANDRGAGDLPMLEEMDTEKRVVKPGQLASIFDNGPSFALPSVRELFEGVIGLYGKKIDTAS